MYDLRILLIWFALGFLLYLISIRPEPAEADRRIESEGKKRADGSFIPDWDWKLNNSDQVVIERLNGLKFVDTFEKDKFRVSDCPVDLIPIHLIESLGVIPLKDDGECIILAMLNPFDLQTVDLIREITGKKIKPIEIDKKDFRSFIGGNMERAGRA